MLALQDIFGKFPQGPVDAGIGRNDSGRPTGFFARIEGRCTETGIGHELDVLQVVTHYGHFVEGPADFPAHLLRGQELARAVLADVFDMQVLRRCSPLATGVP
jgi:hypothetical protein